MENLSQEKRKRMIAFLKKIKEEHKDDDETLIALDEIENELNSKKYGLVWEKHEEKVDRMMQDNIPVFTEVKEREIKATDENSYNFLLEGDNLHSLKLLEKTHAGKIDVIYIDPPYNTGTDKFKYDDKIIDDKDTFRHSKWTSFMYERLSIAKNLCSNNWVLFISIDNNEIATLKMLCDDIFGESNFIGTIDWESKTKSQNTKSSYRKLQPKCEYILCYGSEGSKHKFNLIRTGYKEYSLHDKRGKYREHCLEEMNANGIRGRETMVFDISDGVSTVSPGKGKQWKLGQDQVATYIKRNDLFIRDGKVIIKMRPTDERTEKTIPFWAFLDKTIGTAESAKKELSAIIGSNHGFDTVKPVKVLKQLCFHSTQKDSLILDFFAGSGTTAQAVLELNKEDGGNRKFILCTNNENNICEEITYERIKRVIYGYSYVEKKKNGDVTVNVEGIPANLKYFKTDFIPKDADDVSEELLSHIKEMVELENGITIDNKHYLIILTDEQADELAKNWSNYEDVKAIYVSRNVLFTSEQNTLFRNTEIHTIPDYYFEYELKELGESW